MADIKVFRLTHVGESGGYKAVQSDSVAYQHGEQTELVYGQALAPTAGIKKLLQPDVAWSEAYVARSGIGKATNLGLYYLAFADTGGAGANGISVVGDALIIPATVRCGRSGPAVTSCRAVFLETPTVGTTKLDPPTADHQYIIGETEVNGSALDGIDEQELDFGLEVEFNAGMSGNVSPDTYWITRNAPVCTIRTTDLNVVKDYLTPAAVNSDALVLKFQDETAAAGYQYTIGKAYISGSISNAMGTLTIAALNATTIVSGASY